MEMTKHSEKFIGCQLFLNDQTLISLINQIPKLVMKDERGISLVYENYPVIDLVNSEALKNSPMGLDIEIKPESKIFLKNTFSVSNGFQQGRLNQMVV